MRARKLLLTADDLFRLSTVGRRYELVKGELFEMPPAGGRHGNVAMQIGSLLNTCVRSRQLGHVFAAETGFILGRNPDTVRAPDASFVARGRLPTGDLPAGYLDVAPDLAVEVVSPSDREGEVQDNVADWLQAGTSLVWVIYSATRSVTVCRPMEEFEELSESDSLDGEQVIPGFACNIQDLFS